MFDGFAAAVLRAKGSEADYTPFRVACLGSTFLHTPQKRSPHRVQWGRALCVHIIREKSVQMQPTAPEGRMQFQHVDGPKPLANHLQTAGTAQTACIGAERRFGLADRRKMFNNV